MKIIKKLKILFILSLYFLYSCDEDYSKVNTYELGANVVLNTTSLSNLDENHTMEATIFTGSDVSVNKIQIESEEGNTTDATISGDKATFNSSILGTLYGKKERSITIKTTLSNGIPYTKTSDISVSKALSLEKGLDAIKYNYSKKDSLTFKASTKSAIIDNISLEWKKGKAGTYATTSPLGRTLKVKGESIYFTNFTNTTHNYNLKVKDTLYYRFIARSGALKDTLVTSMPIISQTFENTNKVIFSSDLTKNKLNLSTQKLYTDTNTTDAEIKFMSPSGFEKEGNTNIDFVKVGDLSNEISYYSTTEKLFAEKDLLVAKRLYDAGTKATTFSNTSLGDLYIYKNGTEYGMLKIVGIITTTNNGTTITELNIEFGQAEIHI